MSNNIIDFIKKQDDIFTSAKYFGGMSKLLELSKDNKELTDYIESKSKGSIIIKGYEYKEKVEFNYYLLDFQLEDIDDDDYNHSHVDLIVNLIVDYDNLSKEELLTIGKWAAEYCEDGTLYEVYPPKGLFPDDTVIYYMVAVKEINGEPVPWKMYHLLDNLENTVPDSKAFELIDKSLGNTSLSESLIRIKDLINKIL